MILADRGFRRAAFLRWLKEHHLDYVVRIKEGSCVTEGGDGRRWKLGEEGSKVGELRFLEGVRYGLYHETVPESFGSTWPCVLEDTEGPSGRSPS